MNPGQHSNTVTDVYARRVGDLDNWIDFTQQACNELQGKLVGMQREVKRAKLLTQVFSCPGQEQRDEEHLIKFLNRRMASIHETLDNLVFDVTMMDLTKPKENSAPMTFGRRKSVVPSPTSAERANVSPLLEYAQDAMNQGQPVAYGQNNRKLSAHFH